MSQISLGLALNVSQKMISAYENGKNEPSIDLLIRMADMFHTTIDYLIGYSDIRQYPNSMITEISTESPEYILSVYKQLSSKNKLIAEGVLLGLLSGQNMHT